MVGAQHLNKAQDTLSIFTEKIQSLSHFQIGPVSWRWLLPIILCITCNMYDVWLYNLFNDISFMTSTFNFLNNTLFKQTELNIGVWLSVQLPNLTERS